MPHAVDENSVDVDEDAETQRWLRDNGQVPGGGDINSRPLDLGEKADDAEDYEDISDDDLPEEEEASNVLNGDTEATALYEQLATDVNGLPEAKKPNGYNIEYNGGEQGIDLFGDDEGGNDLFGERTSSPVEEFHRPHSQAQHPPPPLRTTSLALPSKSSLALPNSSVQAPSRTNLSPSSLGSPPYRNGEPFSPGYSGDEDDEDFANMTAAERQQMLLFNESRRRGMGMDVPRASIETDVDLFHTLFPTYNEDDLPLFTELWRPRPGTYRGKVPFKPPKPVQPTKLALDICPDQERNFRTIVGNNKGTIGSKEGVIEVRDDLAGHDDSEDDYGLDTIDENERIGGVTMHDLNLICEDWDMPSLDTASIASTESEAHARSGFINGEREIHEQGRPAKRRKIGHLKSNVSFSVQDHPYAFEDPEREVAKLARSVNLDMNDPNLLLDEHAPQSQRKARRIPGDVRRDAALSRDLAKRYNISNDQAYDLLKENHQHKVRSTLGSVTAEHALPAAKLQYPFYKVRLDGKEMRSFHRKHLELHDRPGKEYRFTRGKFIKKKHVRGREVKDLFAKSEDLSFNDNASTLLLEYSEEAPMMLSNFGMGSRLINYYKKRSKDDPDRPKRDIGETHVLSIEDKSPFSIFGHVDGGEVVPSFQNGMYRAPTFQHSAKPTDFIVAISTTHEDGHHLYLRNVDHLQTVGQQFPLAEVPGEHSRKVTDAAKKRLRAISYRIYHKVLRGQKGAVLDNETMKQHVPGSDTPQIRSKMREFMAYDKGVWVPKPGQPVPDRDTVRGWIRPEDICLLDSMQVGVQHLVDLGLGGDEKDEGKDVDENDNIEKQLAPWQTTKNFINACQGKAMLKLHGEGDPSGRGEAFSFVKTSMKGGFQAIGESVEDKIEAKRRREAGGHSYNVAKQQKAYEEYIRKIWDAQKSSLSNDVEMSDGDYDDDDEADAAYPYGRGATPKSSIGTPAAFGRHEDDSASVFSRQSAGQSDKVMIITREYTDKYGQPQVTKVRIDNPRVMELYKKRRTEIRLNRIKDRNIEVPSDDPDLVAAQKKYLEKELARLERNQARSHARDKVKAKAKAAVGSAASPPAAGSPGQSDADGPSSMLNGGGSTDGTPAKGGRGRNKDGTARKCANCGQVGHIKTNRKSVHIPLCDDCVSNGVVAATAAGQKTAAGSGKTKGTPKKAGGSAAKRVDSAGPGSPATPISMLDSYSKFVI